MRERDAEIAKGKRERAKTLEDLEDIGYELRTLRDERAELDAKLSKLEAEKGDAAREKVRLEKMAQRQRDEKARLEERMYGQLQKMRGEKEQALRAATKSAAREKDAEERAHKFEGMVQGLQDAIKEAHEETVIEQKERRTADKSVDGAMEVVAAALGTTALLFDEFKEFVQRLDLLCNRYSIIIEDGSGQPIPHRSLKLGAAGGGSSGADGEGGEGGGSSSAAESTGEPLAVAKAEAEQKALQTEMVSKYANESLQLMQRISDSVGFEGSGCGGGDRGRDRDI